MTEHPIALPGASTTPTVAMIRTLGLVSAICGLIIVGSYEATLGAAKANRTLAAERAVFRVLPAAKSVTEYHLTATGLQRAEGAEPPAGALKFYAAHDASGRLAGIAAEGAAKGYADVVRVMFGYKPECQCIVGMSVVSMRETPGIGDRILTDLAFLANFKALDVRLNADMQHLANEVKVVKHGTKSKDWQIDAISGATITSRAVGKGINDAAQALLPKLLPALPKLEKP